MLGKISGAFVLRNDDWVDTNSDDVSCGEVAVDFTVIVVVGDGVIVA